MAEIKLGIKLHTVRFYSAVSVPNGRVGGHSTTNTLTVDKSPNNDIARCDDIVFDPEKQAIIYVIGEKVYLVPWVHVLWANPRESTVGVSKKG